MVLFGLLAAFCYFCGSWGISEVYLSESQENRGFLPLLPPPFAVVSLPCIPCGSSQGFSGTRIYVNDLGNHAMTSLASVILHHSLASFPCPDTLNSPDYSATTVHSGSNADLQLVGNSGGKGQPL